MRPYRSQKKEIDSPWHSRGYVPHFDHPDEVQSITFHLYDAMPLKVVQQWKMELEIGTATPQNDPRHVELRRRIAIYGDKGYGECWLRNPVIGKLVENALLHFDNKRYKLLAWCVMPNHLHVLIETVPGWPIGSIIHSWKSYTATFANRLLKRNGPFWERDFHDRYVRNNDHLNNVTQYIENNPVLAGLVRSAHQWKFSSAVRR